MAKILIDIPDEQIEKSLTESKFIHEDEGVKGHVDIMMLYTNGKLEFVDVSRRTEFYSCEYKVLPKGHGILVLDENKVKELQVKLSFSDSLKWLDDVSLSNATLMVIEADKE